jgi:2-iminobutanoate/2-iminopropanoate deaminase
MNAILTPITSNKAASPIGHYSPGIVHGTTLYTSGQIGLDPATLQLKHDTLEAEVNQALDNLTAVIHAAKSSLLHVIKTTLYLTDLSQFDIVNTCYQQRFNEHLPARSCIEVSRLPRDARFEIEAIVALTDQP